MKTFIEDKQRSDAILRIVKDKGFDRGVNGLSIAVMDLTKDSSPIFGINLDTMMYPASVFKIFIGAEVLRQLELGLHVLDEVIVIKPLNEMRKESLLYPDSRSALKTGESVSVDRLLKLMLAASDNTASNCLMEMVGMESIRKHVIEPNGWKGTDVTEYFKNRIQEKKSYRFTETTETNSRHVAEFFALVEQEKLLSTFVSRTLKHYLQKYDRTPKHGYTFLDFLQYRKGGYLETNLYAPLYKKSGFGFSTIRALIKNILTKGWASQRYMHEAGVVQGKRSRYVVVVFTLSKQLNPRKYFHLDELVKDIFLYMENV